MDCLCGAAWCSVSCSGLCSCQKHFLLCRVKLTLQKKHTRSTLLSITTTKKRFSPTCLVRYFYLLLLPWKYKVEYTLKQTQNSKRIKDTHRQAYKCVLYAYTFSAHTDPFTLYCDLLLDSLAIMHTHKKHKPHPHIC